MGRLLLLGELQIRRAGADQHRGAAERLTDGLAEVVLGIGAGLRVVDLDVQLRTCRSRQPPPEPPDRGDKQQCCLALRAR